MLSCVELFPWDRGGSQVCLLITVSASLIINDVQNTNHIPRGYWGGTSQLLLWKNMQSSWEGNGLMNNQRIRQGNPGKLNSQSTCYRNSGMMGLGKTEVIRKSFTKCVCFTGPLEDGQDRERTRRHHPKKWEQCDQGSRGS